MTSPYSDELMKFMDDISNKVDSQPAASSSISSDQKEGPYYAFMSRLDPYMEKYNKHIVSVYLIFAFVGAILFTRSRMDTRKDNTSGKKESMSKMKVIMWFIVFCTPLIIWKYVNRG